MNAQLYKFLLRWFVNGLGLWIAQRLFDTISFDERLSTIVWAGLILSIVNALVKPLLILLTLPAVLLSLGLFMIVINGAAVWLTSYFYGPLQVTSFGGAVLAGLVIGLVNYSLTTLLEDR